MSSVGRTQRVARPRTWDEFEQMLTAGVLITLGGEPLVRATCPVCGAGTLGETCPRSLPCTLPGCWARAGVRCKRPSGHPAAADHVNRTRAAVAVDYQRELVADPRLPAPWPSMPPIPAPDVAVPIRDTLF